MTELEKMILKDGSPKFIRKKTMYSIFDLARASALVQYPKYSGVYKLGIERCTTAIDFLKNVLDQRSETFSPEELAHIKQVVFVHEKLKQYYNIPSA